MYSGCLASTRSGVRTGFGLLRRACGLAQALESNVVADAVAVQDLDPYPRDILAINSYGHRLQLVPVRREVDPCDGLGIDGLSQDLRDKAEGAVGETKPEYTLTGRLNDIATVLPAVVPAHDPDSVQRFAVGAEYCSAYVALRPEVADFVNF